MIFCESSDYTRYTDSLCVCTYMYVGAVFGLVNFVLTLIYDSCGYHKHDYVLWLLLSEFAVQVL